MNSNIKIIDNFLDQKDYKKVIEVRNDISWVLQSSNPDNHVGVFRFLFSDLKDDPFFIDYLFSKVADQLGKGSYILDRVYLNGQWNGREGNFHEDHCDYTGLIYISPYEYGWGGFTEILTKPEPTIIHPIPNRLLIFEGSLTHKAYSFAYQACPLRVSLAFKINKK